ncbi:MAG: hypothetical protein CME70_23960 [Halobacteriovorax sp.]|nr:hypothetical protein [Halobacteriovorax sp.]|tara:strand:- start:22413 stop:22835 length:423 start_codon:yes stop_codon:yes gene_type:complete
MGKKILINDIEYQYDFRQTTEKVEITLDGKVFNFSKKDLNLSNDGRHFVLDNKDFFIEKASSRKSSAASEGSSKSPMPGKILKVLCKEGDAVKKGDPLIIMEAMKMEHTLKASKDGRVKTVKYSEGELVEGQVELVELED